MKIEVAHVTRCFGRIRAVDDVSFEFGSGDVYGFIGPNGAGKSTTMRIIATLDRPDSGDVLCGGVSVIDYPERARRLIGYMPDRLPENDDILVWEYLDFFARAAGIRGAARRKRLAEVEEFTALEGLRTQSLSALSKGMKQRVSLARALVHNPSVLILDEPAAGLDPRARVELRGQIRAVAEQGTAVLISSHILTELQDICNGAVIIEQGRIVRAGSIAELSGEGEKESRRRSVASSASPDSPRIRIEVKLRGDTDGAGLIAQELPLVRRVRHSGPDGLLLEVEGGEREAAGVVATLINEGIVVTEFRPAAESLEQLFMKVTAGRVQ